MPREGSALGRGFETPGGDNVPGGGERVREVREVGKKRTKEGPGAM